MTLCSQERFPLPSPHKSQRTNELWGDRKWNRDAGTWPTLRKKRDNGQVSPAVSSLNDSPFLGHTAQISLETQESELLEGDQESLRPDAFSLMAERL